MRKSILSLACVVAFGVLSIRAQAPDYMGTWTGTWEGMGSSGGFELTLDKGKDGATAGKVSATGEPSYTATTRTLTIEGSKLKAAYDFPPDPSLEVLLDTVFDGDTASGTWTARTKADGGEVASGTWAVKKKK